MVKFNRQNGHARVSVADRGPGIKVIHKDLVFERFGQTDSSSSRKTGGTGLGLNICRAIVEMHNGKIDFKSEYGRGATFFIDLPLHL